MRGTALFNLVISPCFITFLIIKKINNVHVAFSLVWRLGKVFELDHHLPTKRKEKKRKKANLISRMFFYLI